ncbi:DinB family protein [Pseudochryseolinea flava]|uniref:DinB family protein n=1 Tax=Pseudochryseolinea flava TaxID=2059302 RepID=A0A364XYV1_9BACT|nr:DinB family protein [Pseudochryseolinea flava]RAV99463.1 DinB family protein [Pseudochryseolinea flava]
MNLWHPTIDKTTKDFVSTFGDLNERQLNWKPAPQTWSIAQNIDHLIVINNSYFDWIADIRNGKHQVHWLSKFNFMVNFFGKSILKSVQPDRKNRMKTFPRWEPSASTIPGDILEKFQHHQDDLKTLIANSQDLLEKGTVISSPASQVIVYKLETAFDIIVAHEQRHLEQAKEVLSHMQ